MAIAALHLRSRNTGKTMHPTISQSKISLSPFPRSFWSFSLSLFLWCTTLVCASLSNQFADCELECRSTMIGGLSIVGNCERKCAHGVIPPSQEKDDPFHEIFAANFDNAHAGSKHGRDPESHSIEPDRKRPKLEGQTGEGHSLDPGSTQRERKDGETEANDDLSVEVGLEIIGDGEYVLKIKRIMPSSTRDEGEDEVERAKKMTQNAAMLLLHGEMLQEMGEKLLAQSRASLRSMFRKPVPPISKSDS